jgi:hypothetical protein
MHVPIKCSLSQAFSTRDMTLPPIVCRGQQHRLDHCEWAAAETTLLNFHLTPNTHYILIHQPYRLFIVTVLVSRDRRQQNRKHHKWRNDFLKTIRPTSVDLDSSPHILTLSNATTQHLERSQEMATQTGQELLRKQSTSEKICQGYALQERHSRWTTLYHGLLPSSVL